MTPPAMHASKLAIHVRVSDPETVTCNTPTYLHLSPIPEPKTDLSSPQHVIATTFSKAPTYLKHMYLS